jgi:hypothetical protein
MRMDGMGIGMGMDGMMKWGLESDWMVGLDGDWMGIA